MFRPRIFKYCIAKCSLLLVILPETWCSRGRGGHLNNFSLDIFRLVASFSTPNCIHKWHSVQPTTIPQHVFCKFSKYFYEIMWIINILYFIQERFFLIGRREINAQWASGTETSRIPPPYVTIFMFECIFFQTACRFFFNCMILSIESCTSLHKIWNMLSSKSKTLKWLDRTLYIYKFYRYKKMFFTVLSEPHYFKNIVPIRY